MDSKQSMQMIQKAVHTKRIHTIRKDIVMSHLIDPVIMQHNIRGTVAVHIDRIRSIHIEQKHDQANNQKNLRPERFYKFSALFSCGSGEPHHPSSDMKKQCFSADLPA